MPRSTAAPAATEGVSFAMPVDMATRVGQQIVATGSAQHARLGLALRPLQPAGRAQARLDHGLVVQGAQGAAARAGLVRGGVVPAINGQPADSVDRLQRVMASAPKRVALLVWRAGEQLFVPAGPV